MARIRAKAFYDFVKEKILWVVGFLGFSFFANNFSHPESMSPRTWHLILWTPGVLVLVWVLWYAGERAYSRGVKALGRGITERYADASEVDEVWRICRTFYTQDDHVINIDSLRDFMKSNKRTAKLFYENGEAVGLYIIFPIRRDAARKFLDGTFSNAQALNHLHAVKDRGNPSGLYVTNICARGFAARGKALESMLCDIRERIARCPSIRFVFARMANSDGSRIIHKYKFQKIHQNLADLQVWVYRVQPNLPDGVAEIQSGT